MSYSWLKNSDSLLEHAVDLLILNELSLGFSVVRHIHAATYRELNEFYDNVYQQCPEQNVLVCLVAYPLLSIKIHLPQKNWLS